MPSTQRVALGAALALTFGAAAHASALPTFSTTPKTGDPIGTTSKLVRVTVGHHATYDRVVFRFTGGRPGWRTRFVSQPRADGSGLPVAVLGRRYVAMSFMQSRSPAFTSTWRLTPRFRTLKQVRSTGDFEGVVSMAAGLRYHAPYRVFGLTAPYRIVVDFRH